MEQEGVIKYELVFQHEELVIDANVIQDINVCRDLLKQEGLIGQDDNRYDGYGFGNISLRQVSCLPLFLISGTQTGHLAHLSSSSLTLVESIHPDKNTLIAKGGIEPSSEGMTHGVLYQLSEEINAVVHVHSPEIWGKADQLGLSFTSPNTPYGTPQMAKEVKSLAAELLAQKSPFLFVMKGHKDGVVVAGECMAACSELLLETLCLAKNLTIK